jgi:hypothetical protein
LNKHGKQELLKHPNFVHIIKKYQQKIVDELLFIDCIPDILEIKKPEYFDLFEKYLEKYPEKIEEIQSYAFWQELCQNPYAIHIIEKNLHKIPNNYWGAIAKNENAIHLIEKNLDKLNCIGFNSKFQRSYVCWDNLSENPAAISFLKKNVDKISWEFLMKNPNAIQIYEDYPEKIEEIQSYAFWQELCQNPYAIHIIEKNLHKIPDHGWAALVKNENAIHLIEKNLDKLDYIGLNSLYQRTYVCWERLSENPAAISFLKKNIDKIRWEHLIKNPNAIQIYEDYPEKMWNYLWYLDYENISVDMPIFELDYDAIEKRCSIYKEELIAIALHPSRIEKYLNQGIPFKDLDNYI